MPGRWPIFSLIAAPAILTACGSQSGASAPANTGGEAITRQSASTESAPAPATILSRTDRAAIMRAGGFEPTRDPERWNYGEDGCTNVWADVTAKDINGDGQPEAIIDATGDMCFGHNQQHIAIFARSGQNWRELTNFQQRFASYSFHSRPGIAWPDIEIFDTMTGKQLPGGDIEASGCENFLRWNGREYVSGGTSANGKICKLDAAFAKTAAPQAQTAFPPIPQGFYAYGNNCAEAIASGADGEPPIGLVKFTSTGIGEWDGTMQISAFDDIGGSRYRVRGRSFGNGDDPVGEQSDFIIRITGPATFFDETTRQTHRHCPNVPANVRSHYM